MAEKQSIKRFIVRDPHGHIEQEDSFSVVGEVHVNIVPGYGEPYAESEYVNGILNITIHNIEGNGITDITTDSQEGDEAVNTVTIKTNTNPEGVVLEVRNGKRGNGIASISEVLSPEDGGVNTHTITDTDDNEHVFHTRNGQTGKQGIQGDSAVYNPSSPDAPDFVMANTTGQSTTKSMTQKAVTDALEDISLLSKKESTSDLDIVDDYNNVLARFEDGEIKTKNFNSQNTVSAGTVESVSDLNISDEDGNIIAKFKDGHFKTKNFDSKDSVSTPLDVPTDLEITDEEGRVLVKFDNGHIRTKNFDSRALSTIVTGKRMSVIGDSISSYENWVPKNGVNGYSYISYPFYYPQGDVTKVSQTWWYKVISELSLKIGQNCSWSGSLTKGDGTATSTAYAGCSDRRVADLALNGTPDIVVIYMGTNDFTTKDGINVPIGDLTSKSLLPQNGTKTTFSEAYGLMLSKVMAAYPLAQVFCCSLLDTNSQYRDTDGVYPTQNQHGVYLEDYNAKIKELALGYGAHFVDLNNCGITWFNLSQTMVDGNLHPNALGHSLIANAVKKEILRYF